ncbi:MAG TPA: hypothetical protein VFE28_16390 [Candidatus Krumholzibacteria bacterium]|nr:hypothetical protein [Candidatus Krumholzibacteria bacterium]
MSAAQVRKRWSLRKERIVRRVLQTDPSQEYFVYVPSSSGAAAPLFVAVHGISYNAYEQARLFSRYCDVYGAVMVAPHFVAERHSDYQRLGRDGRSTRADVTLDAIIEEAGWLTGASTAQIYLFGYSGGGQFAHRYALAHPHRVARAVVAAAGWYTFPDPRTRFPYGIRRSRELRGVRFDPEEFLRVPLSVFVGDQDTTSEGLRRSGRVNRQQGKTRLERARRWVEAMRVAADTYHLESLVSYEEIAGGQHSFKQLMLEGRLGDRVFDALFGLPAAIGDGGNGHERTHPSSPGGDDDERTVPLASGGPEDERTVPVALRGHDERTVPVAPGGNENEPVGHVAEGGNHGSS